MQDFFSMPLLLLMPLYSNFQPHNTPSSHLLTQTTFIPTPVINTVLSVTVSQILFIKI